MINKDFRIGNYVKGPLGEIAIVDILGHREYPEYIHASFISESGSFSGQNGFTGIELSTEILEKCGFVNDDVFEKMFIYLKNSDYDTDKLSFRKEEGFICFDGIRYRTLFKHIKYLHQLQNLYFALTGEELNYTP